MSFEVSMNIIREKSGNHFDPKLVEVFCSISKTLYSDISKLDTERKLHALLDE